MLITCAIVLVSGVIGLIALKILHNTLKMCIQDNKHDVFVRTKWFTIRVIPTQRQKPQL